MDIYDTFCSAVLRAVPSATRLEQDALRRELREHLADHTAALMELGADAEEAARKADAPAPLEIPCGESEKITFTLMGCYNGLYQGKYRLIKTIFCGGNPFTLAAPFIID